MQWKTPKDNTPHTNAYNFLFSQLSWTQITRCQPTGYNNK